MSTSFLQTTVPFLMQGGLLTLKIWCASAFISLLVGTIWGIGRTRRISGNVITLALDAVTSLFRGIPYYVQLLIAYFVLPHFFTLSISPLTAGIVSLGLCSAAYISQIVKGTLHALPEGQWEACYVLGYSKLQMLRYCILPQMVRNALPMLTSELDQLLKSTSILSSIGILELTRAGMNVIAREMNPTPVYLTIACMYLLASWTLGLISYFIEKRVAYVVR